jgi:hypothetical protein
MRTAQSKTRNNNNRRKHTPRNSCGKCGCQLKSKPKSKFEWIKKIVLKLLHLG